MPTSVSAIQERIRRLAECIEAPADLLPGTSPSGFGRPHIEVDSGYHVVVCERGLELDRRTTADLDELLYWVFEALSHSMATDFEVANRRPGQDFRRILFGRQLYLLAQLNEAWSKRRNDELEAVLAAHPFDDKA